MTKILYINLILYYNAKEKQKQNLSSSKPPNSSNICLVQYSASTACRKEINGIIIKNLGKGKNVEKELTAKFGQYISKKLLLPLKALFTLYLRDHGDT